MNIALIGNTVLRSAIQLNLVSFPSQVPPLMRRQSGDIPERVAQLYFLRGWSIRSIGQRYRLSKAMVQKLLSEWRMRAVAAGYIQDIHPDDIETLSRAHAEYAQQLNLDEEPAWDNAVSKQTFDSLEPVWAFAPPPDGNHAISVKGGA